MKWATKDNGSTATSPLEVKIVLVGDAFCGKSSLISSLITSRIPEIYVPTDFERHSLCTVLSSTRFELSIWDTSGSTSYDNVRPLAYKDANVFMICFDLSDHDSLFRVLNKWFPEVHQTSPSTPIILCGLKSDLREAFLDDVPSTLGSYPSKPARARPVFPEQALEASRQIAAVTYVECVSTTGDNRTAVEAFKVAALAARGRLNSNSNLKKSTSFTTLTRCRSILKLRKCKSRMEMSPLVEDGSCSDPSGGQLSSKARSSVSSVDVTELNLESSHSQKCVIM